MNSRPLYAIREMIPVHHFIYDGIIGWRCWSVRYCLNRDFALKMAGELSARAYRNGGDEYFEVYDMDGKQVHAPDPQAVPGAEPFWAADDFMPF